MEVQGHKIIYKILVGSHAYGTNVEGSDEDIKGIFIQSPESVLEVGYLPQIEVSKDEVYFELGRFIDLISGGNPTMLEMLYAPPDTVLYASELIKPLFIYRDKLLTKQLRLSFGGYAIDQIKKASGLDKKMNWEEERKIRKDVLDFCYIVEVVPFPTNYIAHPLKEIFEKNNIDQKECLLQKIEHFKDCYNLYLYPLKDKGIIDDNSNNVKFVKVPPRYSDGSIPESMGIVQFHKDAYSVHCKEYNSYLTWLKERNEQRYVDVESHGQRIDGKNMLHCIRLIDTATEIARGEGLKVRRPNAEYLKSIRRGEVPLDQILQDANKKISELDELFNKSGLPDKADKEFFKELVISIRKKDRERSYQELIKKLED